MPPRHLQLVSVAAAHDAGLRHVDDRRPGLRRRGHAHPVIEDATGRRVTDARTLERIRRLAIPPAWTNVWICSDARGHIQATGRDARGRKQYRYHARWREERDGTKYGRMLSFARALPTLRERVARDLARPGLPRRKVIAAVVRLLETTFIRVGNEEYARSNKSFGLTTFQDRHVGFGAAKMTFHFRGKSGVVHDVTVHDRKLARIVRRCRDLPGQELFQYVRDDGDQAAIDSADVNAYIRETTGETFTAKDFRTWAGTVLAATAFAELAREATLRPPTRAKGPTKRDVKGAIDRVAARLGNTPSVCRKCYVHPDVVASYLEGSLLAAFARRRGVAPRNTSALRPEETAVLALLRRRDRGKPAARSVRRALAPELRRAA
ncbi:MAG: topA [Myxococcales bacterium]|nr:topA [Myxococcales bacterium]